MFSRREFSGIAATSLALAAIGGGAQAHSQKEDVLVDLLKEIGPLDHVWSKCAGSDRAEITMREDWRRDARRVAGETGVERVRFHGVFDDEMGVWANGYLAPKEPNFQNVDAVYDGLMDLGLQPWVELSFMPGKLASGKQAFGLYRGNITPPQSLTDWGDFIGQFVRHLVDRYGASAVRQWYFEVWNEPNLPFFWAGNQAQYFDFYRTTAGAIKAVDSALKVGGPATASGQWIPEFLDSCSKNGAPVDFVSTHFYAGDNQKEIFGQANKYSQNDVIPEGVAQVRAQIDASPFKGTELWLSEWSSDSPAMIADVVTRCMAHCRGMSHWALSGVFEEIYVPSAILNEDDNGWGLFAPRNIPLPSFNTYKLMNRLGATRLPAQGPALASRLSSGAFAVLIWNLAQVTQAKGLPGAKRHRVSVGEKKSVSVTINGARPGQQVRVSYVDRERGSPYPAWHALGSPQYMTETQLASVRASAEIVAPEIRALNAEGKLTVDLPPEGIALLEIG